MRKVRLTFFDHRAKQAFIVRRLDFVGQLVCVWIQTEYGLMPKTIREGKLFIETEKNGQGEKEEIELTSEPIKNKD